MRFFLLSAFFVVSAGKDITVKGFEKDNVLLPCDCSNRDLKKDFKWQVEEDEMRGVKKVIFINNDRTLDFKDNLSHRYETFFDNDRNNCSVLLKNITQEDQGKYSCRFHSPGYTTLHVNLVVFGMHIFQHKETRPNGGNLYKCVVKLDKKIKKSNIGWTGDGECLSNLTTINISTTYNMDEDTGLHYYHSRLETERNFTSGPQCEVNATCQPEKITSDPENNSSPYFRILYKGVPVVLVLGLIWYLRGTCHRFPSEGDV